MALSGNIDWEVRTDGSDSNGGGFRRTASGTDYCQQAAAQATLSTASVVNSTTSIIDVDPGDYTCTDGDTGNIIQITGGTATAGFYEIIFRFNQQWYLDRSAGTAGQTVVGNMGGALGSPGGLGAALATASPSDGMQAFIKSGTYTLTSASTNVSGGALDLSSALTNIRFRLKGYQTSREDRTGTKPLIYADTFAPTNIVEMAGSSGGSHWVDNISVDGNGQGSTYAVLGSSVFYNFIADVEMTGAVNGGRNVAASRCYAHDLTGSGFISGNTHFCLIDSCDTGCGNDGIHFASIVANCTSTGFTGVRLICINCVTYNNGSHGFDPANLDRPGFITNCVSYSDGGYSFSGVSTSYLINCASDGAVSGRTDGALADVGAITLTADPFTDAAGGDFSLNNAAGGGALLRAAGISVDTQTGYIDVGAVQSAASFVRIDPMFRGMLA